MSENRKYKHKQFSRDVQGREITGGHCAECGHYKAYRADRVCTPCRQKIAKQKQKRLTCGNCDGGLTPNHDEAGITLICSNCNVRVAGPFTDAHDIPKYKEVE